MRRRRRLRRASPQQDYQRAKSKFEELTERIEVALNPEVKLLKRGLEQIEIDLENIKNSVEDYDDMAWELLFEPSYQNLLLRIATKARTLATHARSSDRDYVGLYDELTNAEGRLEEADHELRSTKRTGPEALDHFELTE